ncbi:MAG: GAF and ANTAR domain-containing protein [Actinomycetota bacterium]|nr:GAF and ANTAR domain-containing protein [Actinomycetota bacterium]
MADGQRPVPLAGLDTTAEAVAALRDVVAAEEPLDKVLARVAATAARAIPDADAVSITVLTGDSPRTAAYTDERILELDRRQYESGRAPCTGSARHHRPVHVEIAGGTEPWSEFTEAARRSGVRASLSVPLLVGDDPAELVGSLNVYSYTAPAFDPFDEAVMRLYTVSACQAIANARRWQQSRDTITHLERALTSRAVIDQAKGALMAVHGCTADEAFQRLVEESQRRNIKVHDIARELMASLTAKHR